MTEEERTEEVQRGEGAARQLVGWALDSAEPPQAIDKGLAVIAAARDYLSRYLDRAERTP